METKGITVWVTELGRHPEMAKNSENYLKILVAGERGRREVLRIAKESRNP